MAECAPPVRTVASLASSSFTAAPTNTPTLSVYSVTSSSSRAVMHVFSNHLPRASRIACASVFERVRLQMTGVLRRLSQLAEAVADDLPHLPDAMHAIWETMECELVLFVRTLLAFPTSRYSKDIKEHGQYGISLLPGVSRRGSEGNLGHRQQQPCTWELQRGQSSLDSFVTLVNSIPTLSPSIYNLEVMYSPLQQFILNSSRLQEAWRDKTSPSLGEHGSIRSTLPFLLSRAVDIFVKTVREDVAQYMDNAFGSRAGTLLQPLSMRQRVSHVTSSSQSNILPPLPQTQMLIDVIASCLSLGVAIPSVASRLGEVINNEVIMPFCERAIYALKLAASWTDAGSLVNELVASGAHCAASLSNVTDTSYYVAKQKGPWNTPTVSSDGGEWRELTIHYISQMFEKRKQVKTVSARLLVESEWNAVVRLVANAKFVISELESCMGKSSETMSGGMVADANGSGEGHDGSRLLSLRGILNERGISSGLHGTIVEAIQKTEKGCRILREDVIERGLVLLHCEIALQCFSEVVKSLSIDCSKANGMVKASRGSVKVAKKAEGRTKKKKKNGKALSSMFPISKMGDNLESEGSDDFSSGMPEYDEFGDRIVLVNDTTTDEEIEDCTFPNSLVIGQNDWKGHCKQEEDESEDMQVGPKKGIDDCSKLDRDIMESARVFGEVLSQKDVCISENLSSADRDFIFSQADGSMALGISFSGKMRMTGDRDVATAARTFMDCVAGVAAESIGWSIVESNYSIAEGGSQSASECRSLLCAADMLQIEAKQ